MPARAGCAVHGCSGGEPRGLAGDRRGSVAAQHVEHLVVGRRGLAAAGALEAEQALLELGASALGPEQHVLLVGLDAPAHWATLDTFGEIASAVRRRRLPLGRRAQSALLWDLPRRDADRWQGRRTSCLTRSELQ